MGSIDEGSHCPSCGAQNRADSVECFLCHQPFGLTEPTSAQSPTTWVPSPVSPTDDLAAAHADIQRTFKLSSLMLIIALVAVCLGALVESPGLGVVLIIVAAPALLRTLAAIHYFRGRGQRLTTVDKVLFFVGSLLIVTMILMSTLIAFTIVCFPAGLVAIGTLQGAGFLFAVTAGFVPAVFVAYQTTRALWPYRGRR